MILWAMYAILLLPALYFVMISIYLLGVTMAAHARPPRSAATMTGTTSFAVLIPAHNEELQIEATVRAVLGQNYPRELYGVYVLADNCADLTADMARRSGANAIERFDEANRGKGQALDWCFSTRPELLMQHDAIVILDADATMDPGFLSAMAQVLQDPAVAAVQAHNSVANPHVNWRTALTYAGFALINCVRSAGRIRLGGVAGLKGNGMVFRSEILARYGWPAHSVVEDIEFGVRLLLDGHHVAYCESARVISDMPAGGREATSQRNRWEGGRIGIVARYAPVLLQAYARQPRWKYLDACLDLATPPLSVLVMGQGVLLAASAAGAPYLFPVFALGAAATVLHVVLGLRLARAPRTVWLHLLAVPLFVLWKATLYLRLAVRPRERAWVRTTRNSELRR